MNEPEKAKDEKMLAIKDFVVAVPLCASSLALAWEIGSFAPVSVQAFGFFSITEHIAFALQAFPLAILAACFGIATFLIVGDIYPSNRRSVVQTHSPDGSFKFWTLSASVVASLIFTFLYYWLGVSTFLPISLASLVIGIAFSYRRAFVREKQITGLLAFCFALFITLSLGSDLTRAGLANAKNAMVKIETANAVVDGYVVRAGERGALLFFPPDKKFSFLKWEELKRVDIPYVSMRDRIAPFWAKK